MEEIKSNKIKIPKNLAKSGAMAIGDPLVILKNVAKTYGKEELFSGARMKVMPGDRIAIVGANGMGKTTLLKIIIGEEEADEGTRELHRLARIGYLPQETHWDSLANTVFEEIHSANPKMKVLMDKKNALEKKDREGALTESEAMEYLQLLETYKQNDGYRHEGLIERLLNDFGFAKESWIRTVATLSGGERTKLALAKVVLTSPNVIIMDEPTNHLDIETCEWLEILIHWNIKQSFAFRTTVISWTACAIKLTS